jgi:glutamate--cysteine ligase
MTAQTIINSDAAFDSRHPVEAAGQHVADAALLNGADFRVGLELEFPLLDPSEAGRRPNWSAVQSLITDLPVMPCGGSVTVEPGGQLSTSPQVDVVAAVSVLRADREALRLGLATLGYGSAHFGTDLARPVRRVNPAAPYASP